MTAHYQLEEKNTRPSRHDWSTETSVQTKEVGGTFPNVPFLFK